MMAFAIQYDTKLSNQLRFLLFEIGLGFSFNTMNDLLIQANINLIRSLQGNIKKEGMPMGNTLPLDVHGVLENFKQSYKAQDPSARFYQWDVLQRRIHQQLIEQSLKLAYEMHQACRMEKTLLDTGNRRLIHLSQKVALHESIDLLNHNNHWRSGREILQYSAAFQAKMHVPWLAIPQQHAQSINGIQSLRSILANRYPFEYQSWQQKLIAMRCKPELFYPLPLHTAHWKKLRHHNSVIQNALPISIAVDMHVINSLEQLSPIDSKSPWLRYSAGPERPSIVSRQDCKRINRALDSYCAKNKLSILPVLSTLTIESEGINSLDCVVQENPQNLLKTEDVFPLSSALTSDFSLLDNYLKEKKLSIDAFFEQICIALIAPSLKLLFSQDIALILPPSSCLLSWDPQSKALSVIIINAEVQGLDNSKNTLQESWSQLIAHWQVHLLQDTILHIIKTLEINYGINSALYWKMVAKCITNALPTNTHYASNIFRKQVLEGPWPTKAIISKILNPHSSDFLLAKEENKLKSC